MCLTHRQGAAQRATRASRFESRERRFVPGYRGGFRLESIGVAAERKSSQPSPIQGSAFSASRASW